MRKNTRKQKQPNPNNNNNNNPQHNIRNSSIRAIIGDRRFNDQFNHLNTIATEGTKKLKRVKAGDAEAHDLSNFGRNASSSVSETTRDRRGCGGDLAAKTTEFAFFKRIKGNNISNVHEHEHPSCHENQISKVQDSHNITREEIPNVQKERVKYVRCSSPNEKEQIESHYSFLSPPCHGSNNPAVNGANVQNVKPGERNWLSPSVGSKIKAPAGKGVFSAKRDKLRHLAANRSLYNVNELSSEGFDLVSALISRILPVVQDDNSHRDPGQDKNDFEYKLPPFSVSESAIPIKSHEAYKKKLLESQNILYLEDVFSTPTKKPIDKDLLEWNPTGSGSFSCCHSPYFSKRYNHCQTEGYKREFIKSRHISYLDDCFFKSTNNPTDKDVVEWNPIGFNGLEPSNRHNHHRRAGDFRFQNFDVQSILSFDEPLPMRESRNFRELDGSHLYTEPKLLEQPQPLLLGWDHNSEKDESFFTSSTSPHSSPYITRHLKKERLLTSSISPYSPKHLLALEDCSIKFPLQDYHTWFMNKSINEEEHRLSESSLFLIQSPVNKPLSFQDTGLQSLVGDVENTENLVYGSDQFLKGSVYDYSLTSQMESFLDKHFDHTDYPLLLHDSSMNDEF